MVAFTRRTHVVRCNDNSGPNGTRGKSGQSVDVEVLDAIAFRTINGEEVILNVTAENCSPFIVDDTGDGSDKSPANPTRRTHMERIQSDSDKTQFFDIEVLDAIAFTDANGTEWILDMPKSGVNPFEKTEGTGGSDTTRRTHVEKIGLPVIDGRQADKKFSMSIERCDDIAFRTTNGREMILVCPSADDGSADRASTHITPEGYDPNDESIVPPDNTDPDIYIKFVEKTIKHPAITTFSSFFFVWNNAAPFPTADDFKTVVFDNPPFLIQYGAQFSQMIVFQGLGANPPSAHVGSGGFFGSLAEAQAYADRFNAFYSTSGRILGGYFSPTGGVEGTFGPVSVFAAELVVPTTIPATTVKQVGGLFTGKKIAQGPLWWIRKIGVGKPTGG